MEKVKNPTDIKNAFSPEYKETLELINKSGECPAPFCKDEGNNHIHPVEDGWEHWKVTQNSFNYQKAKYPFLLVLKQHIESFEEVSSEAWLELKEVIEHLRNRFDLKGYTLLWRLGEGSHTGASVKHLHAHLICGYERPDKPPTELSDDEMIKGLLGYAK